MNRAYQGRGPAGCCTVILGSARDGGGTGRSVVRNRLLPSSFQPNLPVYLAFTITVQATVVVFLIEALAPSPIAFSSPPPVRRAKRTAAAPGD
jgi:hypothetical protein